MQDHFSMVGKMGSILCTLCRCSLRGDIGFYILLYTLSGSHDPSSATSTGKLRGLSWSAYVGAVNERGGSLGLGSQWLWKAWSLQCLSWGQAQRDTLPVALHRFLSSFFVSTAPPQPQFWMFLFFFCKSTGKHRENKTALEASGVEWEGSGLRVPRDRDNLYFPRQFPTHLAPHSKLHSNLSKE